MKRFLIVLGIVAGVLAVTSPFWWQPLLTRFGPPEIIALATLIVTAIGVVVAVINHYSKSKTESWSGGISVGGDLTVSAKGKVAGGNITEIHGTDDKTPLAGDKPPRNGGISVDGNLKATSSKIAGGDIVEINTGEDHDRKKKGR